MRFINWASSHITFLLLVVLTAVAYLRGVLYFVRKFRAEEDADKSTKNLMLKIILLLAFYLFLWWVVPIMLRPTSMTYPNF